MPNLLPLLFRLQYSSRPVAVQRRRQGTRPFRLHSLALAAAWAGATVLAGHAAWAQRTAAAPLAAASRTEPIYLSAREVRNLLDQETLAEGEVELRQGGLTLTADTLRYLQAQQLVTATGRVKLDNGNDRFGGSEARYQLETQQGQVLDADYFFSRTGAGGHAKRIDFVGSERLSADEANYTSCPRDGTGGPAWLLSADKIDLDFTTNDGRAQGAVLRFLGVPILGAPVLSFPATDQRKSGWLPPSLNIDSRAGLDLAVPYYWNIAPNRDATFTPEVMTRRGAALQAEFRYLEPGDSGRIDVHTVPHDNAAGRERHSLQLDIEGRRDQFLNGRLQYSTNVQRASDDDYWKDFSRLLPSLTQRLLPTDLKLEQQWDAGGTDRSLALYARVQGWQVLQDTETILPPYQRLPQVGVRLLGSAGPGLRYDLQTEANRFVLSDKPAGDERPDGRRLHLLGTVSRPVDTGWGWLTPRLTVNAASYSTDAAMSDGRRSASRVIPTFSVDSGLRFDRDTSWFGSDLRQTLEPRLHYLNTPRRDQSSLPLFDTAASDFNEVSIYADNGFTGIDRVSDAHQLTVGATTRFLDRTTGVEKLRLGVAQRYQFREQQLTPDGATPTSRFSDLLLFGSTTLVPQWRVDGTLQYSPDSDRVARSIVSTRWQPAPFHTLAATYRYARGTSEQFELGWQWPVYRGAGGSNGGSSCQGTLYGVGRVNYSMKDSRITDSLAGLEYDAGCWIGRVVAERTSTGRTEATTRLMLQLELVGLSRLGTNPLKVLKDNIPGYQLLRDDDAAATTSSSSSR